MANQFSFLSKPNCRNIKNWNTFTGSRRLKKKKKSVILMEEMNDVHSLWRCEKSEEQYKPWLRCASFLLGFLRWAHEFACRLADLGPSGLGAAAADLGPSGSGWVLNPLWAFLNCGECGPGKPLVGLPMRSD